MSARNALFAATQRISNRGVWLALSEVEALHLDRRGCAERRGQHLLRTRFDGCARAPRACPRTLARQGKTDAGVQAICAASSHADSAALQLYFSTTYGRSLEWQGSRELALAARGGSKPLDSEVLGAAGGARSLDSLRRMTALASTSRAAGTAEGSATAAMRSTVRRRWARWSSPGCLRCPSMIAASHAHPSWRPDRCGPHGEERLPAE